MRLIDSDAINISDTLGGTSDFADCIRDAVQEVLNNALTVDAQPVIHAKWVCKDKDGYPINPYCTNCLNAPYYANTIYNYSFCPYCGAKMDEGGEHGE